MSSFPLLTYTNQYFKDVSMKNTIVVACQHFLEANLAMFDFLFEKGLSPVNTYVIGKAYSVNKEIEQEFKSRGVHVRTYAYDSHESFDAQFNSSIKDFLGYVQNSKTTLEKAIIIDDGGQLIQQASTLLKRFSLIGVEQTSSGYNELKNCQFDFPVINVARSRAKLNIESPFIAEHALQRIFDYAKATGLRPKKALVLGQGALGKEITRQLQPYMDVITYDIQPLKSLNPDACLESLLQDFQLIIGCTGNVSLAHTLHSYLAEHTILASVSSSDREFDAVHFRRKIAKTNDPHMHVQIEHIHLLNAGFPVTFTGERNAVAPKKIQLTQALMLAGIYLAQKHKYPNGFINLDEKIQNDLIHNFHY